MTYPAAALHLLPNGVNHNKGGNTPRILVVHIMEDSSIANVDQMFHNPSFQASAHFGVSRAGHVRQWVRTDDMAWHAFAANAYSIGVEHEGLASQGLTDAQIEATGKLFAYYHGVYPAMNLWINTREIGSGLAYHRQYHDWNLNNHSCPGDKAIAQLPKILAVAQANAK